MIHLCKIIILGCLISACQPPMKKEITQEVQLETPKKDFIQGHYDFPQSLGYISDYANLLSENQRKLLEHKLKQFEDKTSNELVVVILKEDSKINMDNFNDYALALSQAWGVGKKYKDNGLTVILSPSLRKIRISTGLATEKVISNKVCDQILKEIILPKFKLGEFYQGLDLGTDQLIKVWEKETQ